MANRTMLNPQEKFITIVSGLPRCGTSLAMQMLQAGGMSVLTDGVRQADEDNPQGYLELEAVKQTANDPSWLAGAEGKAVKMVYRLLYDLPASYTYRVLMMQREMSEVIASQQSMLQRQRRGGAALSEERMIQVFVKEMAACHQWILQQPHIAVLNVNYNELMASPAEQIGRMNEFLGGCLNTAAMGGCIEPALYRQRMSQATAN